MSSKILILSSHDLSRFDLMLLEALKLMDGRTEIVSIGEGITGSNPSQVISEIDMEAINRMSRSFTALERRIIDGLNDVPTDQAPHFRNRDDPWRGNGKRRSRKMK